LIDSFKKKRTFEYQNRINDTPTMKKLTQIILVTMLFTCISWCAHAQPNSSSVFEEVTDTPVNTGILLMAVAGMGYGLKQLKTRKK
jgi:hypothetical protein